MRFVFRLRFHTHGGQSIWLTGEHPLLGSGRPERAFPLRYLNEEFWEGFLNFPTNSVPDAGIVYNYLLRNPDGSFVQDWGNDRRIRADFLDAAEVLIVDSWNDASFVENAFYTELFKDVLLRGNFAGSNPPGVTKVTHTFRVKSPLLAKGQVICMLGNGPRFGNWNTATPILMSFLPGQDYFSAQIDLSGQPFPVEYKYAVYDTERKSFVRFEDGSNRIMRDAAGAERQVIVNDGFARLPLNPWRGAGVAIPVFSLRSEKSFGIGEFTDLMSLTDWCAQIGLKLIQILPINDTSATHTWVDSYPYSSISAFALHPVYLNLNEVAGTSNKKLLAAVEAERQRLNSMAAIDYEAVMKAKLDLLKQIYTSQKGGTFESKAYQKFFDDNEHWLVPYAAFCHLRDRFGTSEINQWPQYRDYDAEEIEVLTSEGSPSYDSVAFNYFVQFHLHTQLQDAANYAHSKGVVLKGDIPIGVARNGADAWQHRELFNLHMQAGAPPDAFTAKGQNWGFPTYNWQRMKEDGFEWWKQRFEQMSRYFDAFRIDHILGFFRIWSIPIDAFDGLMGYFVPALPVHVAEFTNRGIAFDRDRYATPFINEAVLSELFGDSKDVVKRQFLTQTAGTWRLKDEFSSQRKVEAFFAKAEKSEQNESLMAGLFELIGNVILFEDRKTPGTFHFRFGIDKTSSFEALDPNIRGVVWNLYVDYFFRRQDAFWKNEAMEKLPALKRSTNMLVCGEDLGLVPACVPDVMRQLGLLSLEIQRMPKDSRVEFFRPADAPYLSVVTPSTHDMSTIREWWVENRAATQRFFNDELKYPGDAPASCESWISQAVIEQHLASPAMWSIFQLQDLLGMDDELRRPNPADERINVPANFRHYWRFRMHLTLESLQDAGKFNGELKRLVAQHGR
jgi:4-alpha-glucanotransferase